MIEKNKQKTENRNSAKKAYVYIGLYIFIVTSYNMPGIQWTYSSPRPLVASYDIIYLGFSGPVLSPGPHRGKGRVGLAYDTTLLSL